MKDLNNILKFEDFEKNWKANKAAKTKRTEVGLDILKEGIEEDEILDQEALKNSMRDAEEADKKEFDDRFGPDGSEYAENTDEWAVIGYWIEEDEEQWDCLSGENPVSYDEAEDILDEQEVKNWPEGFVHHEEIVSWEEYQEMLEDEEDDSE